MRLNQSKFMIVLAIAILILLVLNIYMIFNLCGGKAGKKIPHSEWILEEHK